MYQRGLWAFVGRWTVSRVIAGPTGLSLLPRLTRELKIGGHILRKSLEIRRRFPFETLELGSSNPKQRRLGGRVRVFTLVHQETFGIDFIEFSHFNNK